VRKKKEKKKKCIKLPVAHSLIENFTPFPGGRPLFAGMGSKVEGSKKRGQKDKRDGCKL
jgi:hypothetical protein